MIVLDLLESGRQIGEKLFLLLSKEQQSALAQFVLERAENNFSSATAIHRLIFQNKYTISPTGQPLTEMQQGDLRLCLEQRSVSVCGQLIVLTEKEFDILALLMENPKRVFTYEMIMELVWREDCVYYSRKAVNNHVSNLRKKLKITPDIPDYIISVYGVGYKFEV